MSRTKGCVGEREVVRKLRELLVGTDASAWRIGHLETSPFAPTGDVVLGTSMVDGIELRAQVRRREQVTDLWAWLGDTDVLMLRKNHTPWLVTLRLEDFAELYRYAREAGYHGKTRR